MAFIAFTPFSQEVEQAPIRHGWPHQINDNENGPLSSDYIN